MFSHCLMNGKAFVSYRPRSTTAYRPVPVGIDYEEMRKIVNKAIADGIISKPEKLPRHSMVSNVEVKPNIVNSGRKVKEAKCEGCRSTFLKTCWMNRFCYSCRVKTMNCPICKNDFSYEARKSGRERITCSYKCAVVSQANKKRKVK